MSTINAATFACDACGKSYRWRPDFAGKKLKCGCGNVMQPAAPPPAPEMAEAPLEDAPRRAPAAGGDCPECSSSIAPGAAICVNCGFNLKTGAKVQTQVVAGAPKTKKEKEAWRSRAVPAKGKPQFKSFADRRLLTDAEDVEKRAKMMDVYLPIGLIVGGIMVAVGGGVWVAGTKGVAFVLVEVAIGTIIDLVLISVAILITARLFSIGLGSIQTALLKVAGIAILPGAISSIIAQKIPFGGDYIGWSISLILYYILLMVLFEMDFQETVICTVIMWAIRTWVGYFIAFLIVSAIMRGGSTSKYDDFGEDGPPANKKPKVKPGKKAPKVEQSDEESLVYPIGDKAVVVFDSARSGTYHLGAGAISA